MTDDVPMAKSSQGTRSAERAGQGPAGRTTGDPGTAIGPGTAPLYQLKAEFFKTLGHPVRIRVLELLSVREHAVSEILPEVDVEPANLSQQLAVLRRARLVVTRREGSAVHYALASPEVAELLRVARGILTGLLTGQAQLLEELRASGRSRSARDTP
jgi:DNA-binding transcriptional ArsR family regulator